MTQAFYDHLAVDLSNACVVLSTAIRYPTEESRKEALDLFDSFCVDAAFALHSGSEEKLQEFAKKWCMGDVSTNCHASN